MLLEKQLAHKQRQIENLKERGDQFNVELEIMIKTDELVRGRLDQKAYVEKINEYNKETLLKAKDSLVYKSPGGSGGRGAISS